eukprot:GEZU01025298.1.p1 GENE.GEZU01025298.1~~GEZU01025298.1.p1  ORF type:complete len:413 (+),score=83.41 GEZU01025298.1:86-1324(+)
MRGAFFVAGINIYSTQCATITSCASTRNSSSNRRYTTSDSSFTPLSANNSKVPTIVAPYWRVFEFRETDKRFEATEIARAEIQRTFRIVNRDLRLFITSWKSQSVILARKKCILVNLPDQSIQAIITSDRMILFNSDDPKVQRLADSIEHDFRSNEYNDTHNPFEFQVLEALLTRACEECDAEYRKISKPIRDLLVDTDLGISDEKLYALLELKNQLDNFQTSVSEIHDAIETVLQSDEDMAEMYLTVKAQFGHRRMIDQHEEIEMLLETYSKQFEDILHRITDLKSSIQSTQDFLTINLDSTRNTMLKLELKLTMASTAMTAGTLIAGILGMNLINHLETHPFAFHFFASFAVLFSMFFYMATTRYAKLAGIFKPRAPLSRRIAELKRTNQIHFESDFDITLTQRSGKNRE